MIELVKYCRKEHFERLMDAGTLRVGTRIGYKDTVLLGHGVGDAFEGFAPVEGRVDVMPPPGPLAGFMARLGVGLGVAFHQSAFYEMGDQYLFCTSDRYSLRDHKRWRNDPAARYNACYVIRSPDRFFQAITDALLRRGVVGSTGYLGFGPIVYYDPPISVNSPLMGVPLPLLKLRVLYGWQYEMRAGWRPVASGPIEHVDVDVPEVRELCTLLRVI